MIHQTTTVGDNPASLSATKSGERPEPTFPTWLSRPVLCALVVLVCVLVTHPFVDVGFNDDFSYIWSAQTLARTGHVTYNGWGAMPLAWQLYLGALCTKLFGYNFTAPRIGVFVISLLTVGLLQRLLVRAGLTERNATFGALTVALSPLFLSLSFTFMTDIPALFCILLCFYGCLRAFQATADREAIAWLAFAAASDVALGTVRQIVWLGLLVVIPGAAWCMRRRRGMLLAGAVLWVAGAAAIFGFLHWFNAQPYTFAETLKARGIVPVRNDVRCLLTMLFWTLPILSAFLVKFPFKRRRVWAAVIALAPFVYLLATHVTRDPASWLFPYSNDALTLKGLEIPQTMLGQRPDVMQPHTRIPLTLLPVATWVACLYFLLQRKLTVRGAESSERVVTRRELLWLFVPYSVAYIALIVTREAIFDRYWVPLLFVVVLALLRIYQSRVGSPLPALSFVALAMLGGFSVAVTHDLFATLRAQTRATEALQAAGIPRDRIYGGVEFDGWTEFLLSGHVNNPKVNNPPNSYRRYLDPPLTACRPWWESWMPDIHAQYELSYEPLNCVGSTKYGPFPYQTWLAPRSRAIYVLGTPRGLITIGSSTSTAESVGATGSNEDRRPASSR